MNTANMQSAVADEVNKRLSKATSDLEKRYQDKGASVETSIDGPTGEAYREQYKRELAAKKQAAKEKASADAQGSESVFSTVEDQIGEEGDDDDKELREIRERRMRMLKTQAQQKAENLGKGHGQYREINQDEFLAEVTSSQRVVCHFYHRDFQRCTIMDHHISKLAPRHVETKFIKINAEKAPFFVNKLIIRTIPSLICFNDGVAAEKILGFDGLSDAMPPGKEDEWPTVVLARALADKKMLDPKNIVDDDEITRSQLSKMEEMRKNMIQNAYLMTELDDGDLSD